MQEGAQQGDGQQLDLSFPAPPDYYSLFTDANLQRLKETDRESALENAELKFLVPPPPPQTGTYSVFGRVWQVHDLLPTLSEQNIPQLYPEGPIDRMAELKRLNRAAVFEFLDLIDVLIKEPAQFSARTERLRDVLVNLHHLINEYREHQAKETLKMMMQQQIDSKRQATQYTLDKCKELEQTIVRLRSEAASAAAEIREAESALTSSTAAATAATTEPMPDLHARASRDGQAAVLAAVQALT
ncbi:Mediator of RNA polymerase II transcription subunit 7 [Coemansia brasiliensis]|uniref:Mediator of RNA polymerase II transcription subunit 7 n=1 Tax=Coemansia brasiliensis TaxID=2650707 RepID=A0A9W8I706_9FUNG|nr:Mediator of RNA polymerase II transcription subunit 7 [Coemansia brasiliensis]